MKYFFTFLILFSVFLIPKCQSYDSALAKLDSFRNQVLIYFYEKNSLDSASIYARLMVKTSREAQLDSMLIVSLGILSAVCDDPDETTLALKESLKLSEQFGDQSMYVQILSTASLHFYQLGNISQSYSYTKKLLEIANDTGDQIAREEGCMSASQIYASLEDYEKAIYYLLELLQCANDNWDPDDLLTKKRKAEIYIGLGSIYQKFSKPDSAQYYYRIGIQAAERDNVLPSIFKGYLNLCNKYMNDYEENGTLLDSIDFALNKATMYMDEANHDQLSYYQKTLAKYYLLTKNYEKSLSYSYALLKQAKLMNNVTDEIDLRTILSRIYEKRNQMDSSLFHFKLASQLKDSLNEITVDYGLSVYEVDRDVLKKEMLNNSLQKEKEFLLNRMKIIKTSAILIGMFFLITLIMGLQWRKSLKNNIYINSKLTVVNKRLDAANQQLEHLLTGVSHDILSRLNLILSYSTLLVEPQKSKDNLDFFYSKTVYTIHSIKDYCTALLQAGWRELSFNEVQNKKIDPNIIIQSILKQMSPILQGKGILVRYKPIPHIFFSESGFQQVIQNLLDNAARYANNEIVISHFEKEDSLEIIISDDGPGVPEEMIDSLFEIESLHFSNSGFRKGLLTVKEIVESMGGNLSYSSSYAQGASFIISLLVSEPKNR
ncbi:MAG: tetratricopeptide repeat-containing sensor histidine kinase [Saprospiraceae bacterium]